MKIECSVEELKLLKDALEYYRSNLGSCLSSVVYERIKNLQAKFE